MKLYTENKKLVNEKGEIFFYTADTAWELFHKLSFDEAKFFIDNRARKGFNVIQTVAVAELDGLHTPTKATNELPFSNLDTLEVNDSYFDYVRKVIEYANSKGIFIALVPMWGSYFVSNPEWGGKVAPVFDADKAYKFLTYLSKKLKGTDLIWILGGDRPYITDESKSVIVNMAKAIREQVGHDQLITAHTQGGRSIHDMLDPYDYLDFITWQSGHMGECYPSWRNTKSDYERLDIPVLDAEPCYESHPIMNEYSFKRMDCGSRFTDFHVRRSAYWSVFSGGCGITYGCYGIWQMRQPEDDNKVIPESAASAYKNDSIPYWYDSVDFPGSAQMGYLRKFIESLPNNKTICPDDSLILSDNSNGRGHMAALTNKENSFIAVYVPEHTHLCVDITKFDGKGFDIYWYDPRYNVKNFLSSGSSETKFLNITSPLSNNDYVLLLIKHS